MMCLRDRFQGWKTIEQNDSDKSFDKEACEWKIRRRQSICTGGAQTGVHHRLGLSPNPTRAAHPT